MCASTEILSKLTWNFSLMIYLRFFSACSWNRVMQIWINPNFSLKFWNLSSRADDFTLPLPSLHHLVPLCWLLTLKFSSRTVWIHLQRHLNQLQMKSLHLCPTSSLSLICFLGSCMLLIADFVVPLSASTVWSTCEWGLDRCGGQLDSRWQRRPGHRSLESYLLNN